MSESANQQPIIIVKKKGGHGGHHGGAWKVAYADFVTAMMALFMVLWLMNTNEETQKAVGGYFRDPSSGAKDGKGSGQAGAGDGLAVSRQDMENLKEKLEAAMKASPNLDKLKEQVAMTVTGEGLRIELLETETGIFFESGNASPSSDCQELLTKMAQELGRLPNTILMEGHTDSRSFNGGGTYTNWELSADRANSARRLMEQHGLRAGQVTQVRGFADRRLRKGDDPAHASNRRISVIVQYQGLPLTEAKEAKKGGGHGEQGAKEQSKGGEHGAPAPSATAHAAKPGGH